MRMSEVTRLLDAATAGDRQAAADLLPLVYDELRKLAAVRMAAESQENTLQATALVHEAYLRLVGTRDQDRWENRGHFFAAAGEAMRRILVDYSRRRGAEKRGGASIHIPLDDALSIPMGKQFDLLALDEALDALSSVQPSKYQVVEMRFFAGLGAKEIAMVLKTTEATVRRDWIIAKGWLFRYLEEHSQA